MRKKAFIAFLMIGALSMVVMSYHYFQSNSAGILKRKEFASSFWYLFSFRTHILLGGIAIVIGPFQFIKKLRNRYKIFHRIIGYIYVTSVLFSALAGLIIAHFAMGGWITTIGFSLLAITWLFTTIKAISSIVVGDVVNHEKWMFLSYGLTFSAIIQRTLLLIPLLTTIPFMPIYQLSAWLPWVLNLSIASILYKRSILEN